jgi:aspartate 1-decarboxylase
VVSGAGGGHMLRCMLRAKIHMATVTGSHLEYEGSITIDRAILEKAGILPYEQVMISNLNNGERLDTYVIPGKRNSGVVCLNGPTARKGVVGDRIIIFSYRFYEDTELKRFKPTIVYLNSANKIIKKK